MLGLSSEIYGRAVLARRRLIEARPASRRRLNRPVISIGNLSVGGTGKTPFTAWLAAGFVAAGQRPAVLSRGYRRTSPAEHVVVVSDGERVLADVAAAGDEPLMIARAVPGAAVLVCGDRYRAGRTAETRLGCTIHLLDDGFQHLRLDRTVDLVLMDEHDLADRPLPAGRLREPLAALRSADAILWTGAEAGAGAAAERAGVPAAFALRRIAGPLRAGEGRPPEPGQPVVALAAIARPERFFAELDAAGLDVRVRLAFRDHHPYTQDDVRRIRQAVTESGATSVVTTEKDLVRLQPLAPLPFAIAWRGLEVAPVDPPAFWAWLSARIAAPGELAPAPGASVA